jgi:hypothetical protein
MSITRRDERRNRKTEKHSILIQIDNQLHACVVGLYSSLNGRVVVHTLERTV